MTFKENCADLRNSQGGRHRSANCASYGVEVVGARPGGRRRRGADGSMGWRWARSTPLHARRCAGRRRGAREYRVLDAARLRASRCAAACRCWPTSKVLAADARALRGRLPSGDSDAVARAEPMHPDPPITDRKIRFALVGCGRIAHNHFDGARAARANARELVAVCDIDPAALARPPQRDRRAAAIASLAAAAGAQRRRRRRARHAQRPASASRRSQVARSGPPRA